MKEDKFIVSILDNDLYKFSMSYFYMKTYPEAEGIFKFKDRDNRVYGEEFIERLNEEIQNLGKLALRDEEFEWAKKTIKYIPQFYWEWLKGFRFDPKKVSAKLDDSGHLNIIVCDLLYKVTFYEVPILALVSELYHEVQGESDDLNIIKKNLDRKITIMNDNELKVADFSTRRRSSFKVQDYVMKTLATGSGRNNCTGTSNCYLAMKYGLKPIGTLAHEVVMAVASFFGYRMANYIVMEGWSDVYHGDLGCMLTDTFGSDIFFKNFSKKHANLFNSIRQDSGDEFEFVDKAIARYRELGIDPRTKTIVFSNALDFPKAVTVKQYCDGKGIRCSFGIGTNLCGNIEQFKPSNIVMKLDSVRISEREDWRKCIKLSDDLGKHMGDEAELQRAAIELGISL